MSFFQSLGDSKLSYDDYISSVTLIINNQAFYKKARLFVINKNSKTLAFKNISIYILRFCQNFGNTSIK